MTLLNVHVYFAGSVELLLTFNTVLVCVGSSMLSLVHANSIKQSMQ